MYRESITWGWLAGLGCLMQLLKTLYAHNKNRLSRCVEGSDPDTVTTLGRDGSDLRVLSRAQRCQCT